ncbi:MAG: 6,7-dimethyl-8-ribityllumazine synthase [Planctomycetes bacterium]|nr:6,7-dimethyl-8-ribityllumazine synthase [Planctomycetota bacterium]
MARNAPPSASSLRLPPDMRLGAVVSTFHHDLTGAMLSSARAALAEAGLADDALHVVEVPGAFEIPIVARSLAMRGDLAAVLCLGIVIKGETTHDFHIASAASHALARVSLDTDKPMLMGILTCNTLEQARERALPGSKHDKGREVAHAAVAVLAALERTREVGGTSRKAGFGVRPGGGQ